MPHWRRRLALVHHGAMLDPCAAELPEIAALVDALLDAHGDWIPPLTGEPAARA